MPPPIRGADGGAPRPRVAIVGAGHGGIEAARALRKVPADILLVDRNNFHKFQPLLYQVATAGLMAGDITQPVRRILHGQRNAEFRHARVQAVDLAERLLLVSDGPPIWYDYLILAPGASTAYFGVEGAAEHALPLKNVADAVNLRAHILSQFEAADRNPALIDGGLLNFVIVGGGPTGVETAGALAELFDCVLRKDFPALDVSRARILLAEMQGALMPGYPRALQDYTQRVLEKRGVEVMLGTSVAAVGPDGVRFGDGTSVTSATVVWAAGVRANPLVEVLDLETGGGGRATVDEYLRVPDHPEVFVVGDAAAATDADGRLLPQLAPVAIQQGRYVARYIARSLQNRPVEPFAYTDRGMMATIGRNAAVARLPGGRTVRGRLAWLVWVFVHIVQLIGFRNQLSVFVNWVYNYFTWDRGPRIILWAVEETDDPHPEDASRRDDGSGRLAEQLEAVNRN